MSSSTDVPPRSRRCSSSTHRSIHSTYRQPTWRSPSFIKTSGSAPSVSVVFAEPEQGAPLAKAAARIPVTGSPLRREEGGREANIDDEPLPSSSSPTPSTSKGTSPMPPELEPPITAQPLPIPAAAIDVPATPQSASPPKEAPLVIPSTPPPTYPLILDPHDTSPTPEMTEQERPPVYTASRSAPPPSLPPTTPVKNPPPNPSSSRFTLSIPLLGRAKVPLGSVLGKEKGKGRERGNMDSVTGTECNRPELSEGDRDTAKGGSSLVAAGVEVGDAGNGPREPSVVDGGMTKGGGSLVAAGVQSEVRDAKEGDDKRASERDGGTTKGDKLLDAAGVHNDAGDGKEVRGRASVIDGATLAAAGAASKMGDSKDERGNGCDKDQESERAGLIEGVTAASGVSGPSPTTIPAPPTMTTTTTTTPTTTTSPETTTMTTSEAVSEPNPPQESQSSLTPAVTTTTWWSYVGWSSTATTSVAVEASGGGVDVSGVEESVPEESVPAVGSEAGLREGGYVQDVLPVHPEDAVSNELEGVSEPDTHISESSTTTTTAMTTWLTPWTWYYTPTTTSDIHSDSEKHAEEEERAYHHGDETVQRDSQPVTDGVFSDTTTTNASTDISSTVYPPQPHTLISEHHNPIVATLTSHTSGWASFFSSNSLMVKTLGYRSANAGLIEDSVKRDVDGVEVMDLDSDLEDDDTGERGRDGEPKVVVKSGPSTEVVAASAQLKANAKRMKGKVVSSALPPLGMVFGDGKEGVGAGENKASTTTPTTKKKTKTPASSPSTPKKGASGTSTPAPVGISPSTSTSTSNKPSTSKDNVDDKPPSSSSTSTPTKPIPTPIDKSKSHPKSKPQSRTSSPSPSLSKKSTSSSSPGPASAPPPPNLVLPTWTDTFYTAPRNVVPPKETPHDQGLGGKLLGKTMKFVSGFWGASGEGGGTTGRSGGTVRGKGKERVRDGSADTYTLRRDTWKGGDGNVGESLVDKDRRERFREFGRELPKAWGVLEGEGVDMRTRGMGSVLGTRSRVSSLSSTSSSASFSSAAAALKGTIKGKDKSPVDEGGLHDVLRGCRRVVVIGVHGWFPGAMIRSVLGEPTGTSSKFANMTEQALLEFEEVHGVKFDKISKVPLEGDGTIERRVERLYANLKANDEWMSDLHEADAIIVATHSQGSIVSTHLLDRLMRDGHIVTALNQHPDEDLDHQQSQAIPVGIGAGVFPSSIGIGSVQEEPVRKRRKVQRVCCLALCGIHLGPLRYLSSSTLVGPYLHYFESTAARELFEFQNTESAVSKAYLAALQNVLDHGTKVVYVASLNDQVVPIYSGLFTAVSHPLILRALYIDGDAYHSSDFLSNLLVLLLRILNSGISDSGLIAHLSEATAGSLNGVGHSTAYEELATYRLAVQYLFLANNGFPTTPLNIEPFNATHEQNDYEIPWSLRDIIADERVAFYFGREIVKLRDAFREWVPRTSVLRDLKRKLQPIQRLPVGFLEGVGVGGSKL